MLRLAGVHGAPLREILATLTEALGTSVAGPGDVDNDGVPDLAAGAPLALQVLPTLSTPGAVRVWSGASGAEIRTWRGAAHASASEPPSRPAATSTATACRLASAAVGHDRPRERGASSP